MRTAALTLLVARAAALEYCSALNDGQCETLRAHDTGAPVFLDTGSLGGETSLADLLDTGIKELKYGSRHTDAANGATVANPGGEAGSKFKKVD